MMCDMLNGGDETTERNTGARDEGTRRRKDVWEKVKLN